LHNAPFNASTLKTHTKRESAGQRRRDREAKQHEASSVVQQALAFEQHQQPARQPDALKHGPAATASGGETIASSRMPPRLRLNSAQTEK
jgi:hypothetical protein